MQWSYITPDADKPPPPPGSQGYRIASRRPGTLAPNSPRGSALISILYSSVSKRSPTRKQITRTILRFNQYSLLISALSGPANRFACCCCLFCIPLPRPTAWHSAGVGGAASRARHCPPCPPVPQHFLLLAYKMRFNQYPLLISTLLIGVLAFT